MARRRRTEDKTIRADWWESHETVLIRSLREADNEWIQDQLAESVMAAPNRRESQAEQRAMMQYRLGTSRRLTMLRGIVSWTLTDELGNTLPLTEESIKDLMPEDADYIYSEINALNQPMTEDQKKRSSTNVGGGSVVLLKEYQTQ